MNIERPVGYKILGPSKEAKSLLGIGVKPSNRSGFRVGRGTILAGGGILTGVVSIIYGLPAIISSFSVAQEKSDRVQDNIVNASRGALQARTARDTLRNEDLLLSQELIDISTPGFPELMFVKEYVDRAFQLLTTRGLNGSEISFQDELKKARGAVMEKMLPYNPSKLFIAKGQISSGIQIGSGIRLMPRLDDNNIDTVRAGFGMRVYAFLPILSENGDRLYFGLTRPVRVNKVPDDAQTPNFVKGNLVEPGWVYLGHKPKNSGVIVWDGAEPESSVTELVQMPQTDDGVTIKVTGPK